MSNVEIFEGNYFIENAFAGAFFPPQARRNRLLNDDTEISDHYNFFSRKCCRRITFLCRVDSLENIRNEACTACFALSFGVIIAAACRIANRSYRFPLRIDVTI